METGTSTQTPAPVIWLTGCVKKAANPQSILPYAGRPDVGVLVTPDIKSYRNWIDAFGGTWALDNACFSQADPWDETDDMTGRKERNWIRTMEQCQPWRSTCLWASVPDVVGDHSETLRRWAKYFRYAVAAGYRPAFVIQNGATVAEVPWDEAEAIFVGGVTECLPCGWTRPAAEFRTTRCPHCAARLTEWKESEAARVIVAEARRRNLPVHMGRTNGEARLRVCADWNVQSGDGTYLISGDVANIIGALDAVNVRPFDAKVGAGEAPVEAWVTQGSLFD